MDISGLIFGRRMGLHIITGSRSFNFNVAYEISLNSGEHVILKIAPLKETRVMTYEKNFMFREVEAMKTAKKSSEIPYKGRQT